MVTFSRDVLVDFLLRGGGRVSHAALLEHFKPLFPEDPRGRASVRDSFKKCVDSVAVVRTEDGVRYVCLKRRFQPPGREDRAGTGPGDSFRGQTAAGTSTSSAARLGGHGEQRELPTMVSSSPEVRRSVVLRSWDPDAAGDAVSLASSLEDERAAVTLDPLEHEWMLCASDGEWPCLQRLLEAEPGLVLKRDFVTGFTCLHWAAKLGRPELLALIVNFARQRAVPVDVDVRSSAGYTPLHVAAMHHHLEVVKLLVGAYGADVEARDHGGRKACQYLRDGVSGDIRDIVGASHGAADPPRAVPDHGGRWRLSRALQANPRPPGDPADGEQPPLRRRASLSKLQKLRSRTSQLVHSTTFHGPGDLPASWRGSFRLRPKTHFFG
uniref:Sosondowah ankyrin repeat domain family member C n=1 Tax=Salarias fasciatus TaxID=181472 RepID=A0A672HWB3_SALFA